MDSNLGASTGTRWRTFVTGIPVDHWCCFGGAKKISQVLPHWAEVEETTQENHSYNPRGANNGTIIQGYRYVGQDNSFRGPLPILLSEASECVLFFILDLSGDGAHIACHMSDSTKSCNEFTEKLQVFFRNCDQNSLAMLICSDNVHAKDGTSYSLENVMKCLEDATNQQIRQRLAQTTYVIEGQGSDRWDALSSVCVNKAGKQPRLKIIFMK